MIDLPQKLCVTGAAGGLGKAVCRDLVANGFAVRAFVRPQDLIPHDLQEQVEVVEGDVQDHDAVMNAVKGTDSVVHCAALLPNSGHLGAEAFRRTNVEGTINVLHAACRYKCARLLHFSTISVVDALRLREPPSGLFEYVTTDDPYLRSKIEAERALWSDSRFQGALMVARLAYVYGPDSFAVWSDALALLEQHRMRLLNNGRAKLPLVYAPDMARFISMWFSTASEPKGREVRVFANPEPTTMADVFGLLADNLGLARPGHIPAFAAEVAARCAGILPNRFRSGRLRLLTVARVRQFSRGYNLQGAPIDWSGLGLTSYKEGIPAMAAGYREFKKIKYG